jgi:hypothetical protein
MLFYKIKIKICQNRRHHFLMEFQQFKCLNTRIIFEKLILEI